MSAAKRGEEGKWWEREGLTGRSLSMQEYLEVVVKWVDRHYVEDARMGRPPFQSDSERIADLRDAIQSAEQLRLLKRVTAGEDWWEIKASTEGGRLE